MKHEICCIFIILIVFSNNSLALPQDDHNKVIPSILDLNVQPNVNNPSSGQPITIYFNITNIETASKCIATDIRLDFVFSEHINSPPKQMRITYNDHTDNAINKYRLSSQFNNRPLDRANWATIDVNKKLNKSFINISISRLGSKETASIQYRTTIRDILGLDSFKIGKIDYFHWDRPNNAQEKEPFIDWIYLNNKCNFSIEISTKHNIISQDEFKCELFNNTELIFNHEQIDNISKNEPFILK